MHRAITIVVPPEHTDRVLDELARVEDVIGLAVQRGASVKPPGDLVVVHTLNRAADAVMRVAQAVQAEGRGYVFNAPLTTMNAPDRQAAIDHDRDQALWEEVESGLRYQGQLSSNTLLLMAAGGCVAVTGFLAGPASQAIAFVAASVIAPGFEPVAKIPVGLALGQWDLVRSGLRSLVVGYAVLVLGAALAFLVLRWEDPSAVETFTRNPAVERLAHPPLAEGLLSLAAALAGITMILAHRQNVIAGPLIALALIPAAAMAGASAAAGRPDLAREGLERLGFDILCIAGWGVLLVRLKQRFVHRRPPME